jgi:hypothetical protein
VATTAVNIKKQGGEAATQVKLALDQSALDPKADPHSVLFPSLKSP